MCKILATRFTKEGERLQRQRTIQDRMYLKKIDFVFYNEEEIRELIEEKRLSENAPEIRNGSGISDPTASAAINNLTPITSVKICGQELPNPERWLMVVDKTYNWCRRYGYYNIVKRRYSGEYFRRICDDNAISEANFYKIWERARNYAALQAAQFNLIWID